MATSYVQTTQHSTERSGRKIAQNIEKIEKRKTPSGGSARPGPPVQFWRKKSRKPALEYSPAQHSTEQHNTAHSTAQHSTVSTSACQFSVAVLGVRRRDGLHPKNLSKSTLWKKNHEHVSTNLFSKSIFRKTLSEKQLSQKIPRRYRNPNFWQIFQKTKIYWDGRCTSHPAMPSRRGRCQKIISLMRRTSNS